MKMLSNRLAGTTSTYLQQHLDNPVHWQPWDQQALDTAKQLDKPILLSIGYAACHWCHVMAHQSFEDHAIAKLMNDYFINIKVDRQQRPDLDSQYQLTHQLFTGRAGGWPLTVFLDPQDLTPFFAGTYFPPAPSRGMPGFPDILQRLALLFKDRRSDLQQQALKIRQALTEITNVTASTEPINDQSLQQARERLLGSIDDQHGGIGEAPKFPRCPELNLLALLAHKQDKHCATALQNALQAILDGGLYDHIGGGFYRYCVDGQWDIPHFEKMLYDNAQLLPLLADQADNLNNARTAINDTVAWLDRRMSLPNDHGILYIAAVDADSLDQAGHSEEGAYYLWQPQQVQQLLDAKQYTEFANHYGLNQAANFEDQAWHLRCQPGQLANQQLDKARQTLLLNRQQRSLPTLDTQALCGWNALLAYGLLQAGYRLSDQALISKGSQLTTSLWNTLWLENNSQAQLCQRFANHQAGGEAFLDDAASLLLAMVTGLQQRVQPAQLQHCYQLADYLLAQFYDASQGGFWLSPHGYTDLLVRSKPFLDDATPAGNALACLALLRLGHLSGNNRYLDAAEKPLQAAQADLQRYPGAGASMLLALDYYLNPPAQVLAYGDFEQTEIDAWLARSDVDSYFIDRQSDWQQQPESILSDFLETSQENSTNVMVCLNHHCLPLCASLQQAEQQLQQ